MLDYGCAPLCHIKAIIKLVYHLVNDKRFLFQKKKKSKDIISYSPCQFG